MAFTMDSLETIYLTQTSQITSWVYGSSTATSTLSTATATSTMMYDSQHFGLQHYGLYVETVVESVPASCANYMQYGRDLQANQDISGLGIVFSFLISAYVVLIWVFAAYALGMIPSSLLKTVDTRIFRANSRRADGHWGKSLQQITLILSDQQLITGTAILIAGYVSLIWTDKNISAFHWQTVTYMAWMSSNVHLTTLTLLRDWLRERKIIMRWRILGMAALLVLLLGALVPTLHPAWAYAMSGSMDAHGVGVNLVTRDLTEDTPIPAWDPLTASWLYEGSSSRVLGTPAICFIGTLSGGGVNLNTVLSYVILVLGYAWKLGQLFESSASLTRKWFRSTPEWLLERAAVHALRGRSTRPRLSRAGFFVVMLFYVPMMAFYELLDSFAASLWFLVIGLVVGTTDVLMPRGYVSQSVLSVESTWAFGQILPLLFLLQPASAFLEMLSDNPKDGHDTSTGTDTLNAPADKHNIPTLPLDSNPSQSCTLSDLFVNLSPKPPSTKSTLTSPEPHITFLYTSRLFRSLIWNLQFLVFGQAVVTLFLITSFDSSPVNGSIDRKSTPSIPRSFPWISFGAGCCLAAMGVHVLCGSWGSRLFR